MVQLPVVLEPGSNGTRQPGEAGSGCKIKFHLGIIGDTEPGAPSGS